MIRPIRPAAWAALALALNSGISMAQDEPDPLAGPKVQQPAERTSLVERGYNGELSPLDAPPEVAALDLLGLSGEQWAPVDEVLTRRAAAIDAVVVKHIQTLVELQSAKATGDNAEQRRLIGLIVEDLRDLRRSGRFVDQVAAALPEDKRAAYKTLVRERHLADYQQHRAQLEQEGAERAESQAFQRLMLQALGQEIQRSYDRIAVQGTQRLDELLAELDLEPAVEAEVRRLVSESAQRTALNPTPEQRRELFAQVHRALPPEAQRRLAQLYRSP